MFIRTPYNYDRNAASVACGVTTDEPSKTDQSFKAECDINTITRRFGLGYEMPQSLRVPQYGDFTGLDSYQEALHALQEASASFDSLPANVRRRFENDPGQFVEFCLDSKNRDEGVQLGLWKTPDAEDPTPPVGGVPPSS